MPPSEERIPVLIIAGFLGAGKTTFIRELIPRLAEGTRAPYVILNDFLNASIDASTLKGLGAKIKELAAGCVCCDETDGLVDAILQVPVSIRPLIIIEANGTTDPYRLIETLTLSPQLRDRIGPILQATVVNESRWGKRWLSGDKRTERAQVSTASAILTNRGERASDRQMRKLRDDLAVLNPRAPLMGADAFIDLLLRESAAENLPPPDGSDPIPHSHHHVAVSLTPPEMSEDRLRAWLQSLPRDILRVKGLVRISEEEMCYFSRTDDPFESPRIIKVSGQEGMNPAVVFIGTVLREDYLRTSFQSTEAAPTFRLF